MTDLGITEKSALAQWRRNLTSRWRAWRRDTANRRRYGSAAPLFAERLWIPTEKLQWAMKHWSSKHSGQVIERWPDTPPAPVRELTTVKACLAHWCDGLSWEETGIFAVMMSAIDRQGRVDRMTSITDIQQRYSYLDQLFARVQAEAQLQTRGQLIKGNFREEGGVLVHIGPDGQAYFGGKGTHRLALALAAKLPYLPAQLGCVHWDGLDSLQLWRQPPGGYEHPGQADERMH